MRKILWYSSINELDYEMQMLFDHLPGYELRLAVPSSGNDYFFPVPIRIDDTSVVTRDEMAGLLRSYRPDLVVHRYRRENAPLLEAAEEVGIPVLVWVTEQGPDRDIEWDRNRDYRNLAANNPFDVEYFRSRGVENVYYWPFGFLPFFHRPVPPDERYRTDFVGYGNPIYNWYDCKRDSVDTVVVPLVQGGYQVALWGRKSGPAGGWLDVPGVREGVHYKGTFDYDDLPAVNSSARMVLGITSNGRYGAFGSRLARALGSRAFCIWAYSEGMEEMSEGFANHQNCCWSRHPDETLEIAQYYLNNEEARAKVAEAGQRLAFEKLNYLDLVPPILEDVIERQPRRAHSRYYALARALGRAGARRQPETVLECGYQIMAHDATGLTYQMAIAMAEACLSRRKFRLTLRYLREFRRLFGNLERRLGRSAQRPDLGPEAARLYRCVVDSVLASGRNVPDVEGARLLLEGIVSMDVAAEVVDPLVRQLARQFSQECYREGRSPEALRAFSVYRYLHGFQDLGAEDYRRLVTELVKTLQEKSFEPSGSAAEESDRCSRWELFLHAASRIPLDRERILLAGDVLPGQAPWIAHNVGPCTWLRDDSEALDEGEAGAIPDSRRAATETRDEAAVGTPDALLYLALSDHPAHALRLERLVGRLGSGGFVLLVSRGLGLPLRPTGREELDGLRAFDFPRQSPLAGPIAMVAAWQGGLSVDRLLHLARYLSQRLEPRISHVTLDPLEILYGLYAWSEGYVRVMQHVCAHEGMRTRARTVQAPAESGVTFARERVHTLLEVELDDAWTTWDPMLGIGYRGTVDDLLASPSRGEQTLGRAEGPYWGKYHLSRYTGREFWSAVQQVAGRDDLEAPPAFSAVARAAEAEAVQR